MKITMDTTFQEIRDAFANINADDIEHDEFALQMKEARNNTKNNGKILNQEFDFFISIILGGYKRSVNDNKEIVNYNMTFFPNSKSGNPWGIAFEASMGLSSNQIKKYDDAAEVKSLKMIKH